MHARTRHYRLELGKLTLPTKNFDQRQENRPWPPSETQTCPGEDNSDRTECGQDVPEGWGTPVRVSLFDRRHTLYGKRFEDALNGDLRAPRRRAGDR
jgi:hypothetical protein